MDKKINFYETDLIAIIRKVAKEEIAISPTFQTYVTPGNSNYAKSTQNAYPIMSLGTGAGLEDGIPPIGY